MVWNKGPATQTEKIWELHLKGLSNLEISTAMGITRSSVSNAIHTGRQRGHIPPLPPKQDNAKSKCMRLGLNLGSVQRVLDELSPDQQDWILEQCIDYQMKTVSEWITEMIRDLYEERAQ